MAETQSLYEEWLTTPAGARIPDAIANAIVAIAKTTYKEKRRETRDVRTHADDIRGEAACACVDALRKIHGQPPKADIEAYLAECSRNAIKNYVNAKIPMISPSASTVQRDRNKGSNEPRVVCRGVNDPDVTLAHREGDYRHIDAEIDMRRLLAACENEREREFVELSADGMSDNKIAAQWGVDRGQVNRLRKRLQERHVSAGESLAV